MQRDNIPALTQSAIAHAQFETIHPFPDGNGRTGRALVGSMLRNKGVTEKVTIPVSSGLLTDTAAYFNALGAYRESDIEPIVVMFAESTFRATDNGRKLAEDIRNVREQVLAGFVRAPGEGLKQATELIFREPAMTARLLMHATGQRTWIAPGSSRPLTISQPEPVGACADEIDASPRAVDAECSAQGPEAGGLLPAGAAESLGLQRTLKLVALLDEDAAQRLGG